MVVNPCVAMDDAYARIWKEEVMVYFKVISPYLLTDEENNNNNKIMIAVSRQILEPSNL
jgi:hypothetical protein